MSLIFPSFKQGDSIKQDFLLRDLWDANSCSWKDWCSMAQEFAFSLGLTHFFGDCWAHPAGRSLQNEH
jgi:hypothetical protein